MPSLATRPARLIRSLAILCLLIAVSGCGAGRSVAIRPSDDILILVSIDGFRADYLDRGVTPHLTALAASGVRAQALRPAFPSLTFPNHFSIVTGLYPDHHGIVHNVMEAPSLSERFVYNKADTTTDPSWWQGEPIWVGAERQGVRTATMFWPGSDVAIGGTRPSHWKPFDKRLSPSARVDTLLGWLDLPQAQRPRFSTLYFEQVDRAGHDHGPDSPAVNMALADLDAALGRLIDGLAARGLAGKINLVIVSDHGMSSANSRNVIVIDDLLDLQRVRGVTFGVVAGFKPRPGHARYAATTLLKPHPHMDCWAKSTLPARLHYGSHARIPAIVCLAQPGWMISTRQWVAEHPGEPSGGEHGYDNDHPDMRAIFIANGPAFRQGVVVPEFNNVDIYPLLAHLLHIRPAKNDGDATTMRALLRESRSN